jgi:hypothetical protein
MSRPITHSRAVTYPDTRDAAVIRAWAALDAKIKMHNMARTCAGLPNKGARNAWLGEVQKHHGAAFAARIKKLTARYWRERNRLLAAQGKK